MIRFDRTGNSANLAMWYKDISFTLEELIDIDGTVTKECWKYLVGKFCEREREQRRDSELVCDIYEEMGGIFGYTKTSLKKVVNYTNSVDRIQKFLPDIAEDILNGKVSISAIDTIALAKLNFSEISNVILRISSESTLPKIIINEQKALRKKTDRRGRPKQAKNEVARISVKDTPAHDPDAQINGLTYTIPSWISIIERTFSASNVSEVSSLAKNKLACELNKLTVAINSTESLI